MGGKFSRNKGASFEREMANYFKEQWGLTECRRGIQTRAGGKEAADIENAIIGCHLELKRVERLSLSAAMRQAIDDSEGKIPVVISKKSREPALVTVRLEDLIPFARLCLLSLNSEQCLEETTGS